MEWIPITDYENGINLNDRPRLLTDEEIAYIVSHFPTPPSADLNAAEVARQGIIEWMIGTLKEVRLCPSGIPDLIKTLIHQHHKSLVVPGTPVGITAAEAVGAITTQMTLNSVAPWEKILIQESNGTPKLIKIGDWIDELLKVRADKIQHVPENRTEYLELSDPVVIASPDEYGNVKWEKVTAVTRHLPVGDMIKIKTRSGREVTATQSKSLLVWKDNKLVQVEGKCVKVDDLVPVLAEIPACPITVDEIDLRKFLSPKEWVYGSELENLYKEYQEYNVPGKQRFWKVKDRLANLPYSCGDAAMEACRNGLETNKIRPGFIYPKSWGGSTNTRIPEKIKLTKQFGQVVGIYLAEGLATDTYISISNNADEIQNLIYKWCDSIGVTYHTTVTDSNRGRSTDTNIHSVLLARFFKKWMNTGSPNKIIPPEILLANKEFIVGVLDGYFAGDGTVNQRDGYLCITSASKDLITGFGFLCSRLGIFGKQSGYQPKSNNIGSLNINYVNTYTIRNHNALLWNTIIGSCHDEKSEKMKLMDSVQDKQTKWGRYYDKQNNVMLDPIVSVEIVPATEYVYDLTVPTTTNFSLWNGLGVADTFHTSGSSKSVSFGIEAMRDLIFARKNPKNESSTIYYTNKRATYEEILDSRRYIVGSVISDFLIKDPLHRYDIDSPDVLPRYWWHDSAPILLDKQIPQSTKVLRLYLDITEMFKHKVTITELASALEREIPPSSTTIYGPIGDGIIDVYPHPNIITDTLRSKQRGVIPPELAELTYLETIVVPELSNIRVKGISGIKQLYPIVSPVWRMVILERKLISNDITSEELDKVLSPHLNRGWILFYNQDIMVSTGLEPENLAALCQLAGLQIIGGSNDRLIVSMPDDRFRTNRGEVVINVNDRMYRVINENSIKLFEGLLYRELEETNIKQTPEGWLEEVDDKVFDIVPLNDIRNINGVYYRRIYDTMIVKRDNITYELVTNPKIKINEMKPSEYIQQKVANDKIARRAEIKRLSDEIFEKAKLLSGEEKKALIRKPIIVPRTKLMEASEFVIAETDGNNLRELLSLPGIDKRRTTCNNMYTITETLGIEAARTFLIRSLHNTITNTGSYVHPANITLIAEFITSRGEPYGATYTGISRQPGGHLSLATLERAGKVFMTNALHGRKEDIRNVSASVAVGARMAIGDGYFDIAQDIVENGVQRTVINDDLFDVLEKDDSTKQLASKPITSDDLISGIDALKTITVGGGFDFTGGEKESNLITLFNPADVVPEVEISRPTEPVPAKKVVRRVAPVAPQPSIDVPNELVDVLTQIKVGVPLPGESDQLVIKPLEKGIEQLKIESSYTEPIISGGLITLDKIVPPTSETLTFPTELDDLLAEYSNIINQEDITVFTELPKVEIPELPDLSSLNLGRDLIDVRREQIRELQPIDIKSLETKLNKV